MLIPLANLLCTYILKYKLRPLTYPNSRDLAGYPFSQDNLGPLSMQACNGGLLLPTVSKLRTKKPNPMDMKERPSIETIEHFFRYDPETGDITWRVPAAHRVKAGQTAGSRNAKGQIVIRLQGKLLKAHIIAYALMTGEWPTGVVSHKDGKRDNNRWSNLEHVTESQQAWLHAEAPPNSTGHRGVRYDKRRRKYEAFIKEGGKRRRLGRFNTPEEASQAYEAEAQRIRGNTTARPAPPRVASRSP